MNARKLCLILASSLMVLVLAACSQQSGQSSNSSQSGQSSEASEPAEQSQPSDTEDSGTDAGSTIMPSKEGTAIGDSALDSTFTYNGVTIPINSNWNNFLSNGFQPIKEKGSSSSILIDTYCDGQTKDYAAFKPYVSEISNNNAEFVEENTWTADGITYHVYSSSYPDSINGEGYTSYLVGDLGDGTGFAVRFFLMGDCAGTSNIELRDGIFSGTTFDQSQFDESKCRKPKDSSDSSGSSSDSSASGSSNSSGFLSQLARLGTFEATDISGYGDDVIDVPCAGIPCLMMITHDGSSNFIVKSYTSSGQHVDTLINEIGYYNGTVTSYYDCTETDMLEVHADGGWNIHFAPMTDMTKAENGSTFYGDDVVYIDESSMSKIHFTHNGESNFIVKAVGVNNAKTLINEIGSYDGTVIWNEGGSFFVVHADGDWTISW